MPRVTVSSATPEDAPALIQAHIDSRSHHHPWVSTFTDQAGFDQWYARMIDGADVGLVARHNDDGGIVGLCTLSQIVRGLFQSAYLGFHGMAAFARRGLMTEAVGLTADYAFTTLALHRLEANIQPDNHASVDLVRRVGFTKEGYSRDYLKIGGVWRDHERWALLATDRSGA